MRILFLFFEKFHIIFLQKARSPHFFTFPNVRNMFVFIEEQIFAFVRILNRFGHKAIEMIISHFAVKLYADGDCRFLWLDHVHRLSIFMIFFKVSIV